MQQKFTRTQASIKIRIDGKLLPVNQAKASGLLFTNVPSKTEIRKTILEMDGRKIINRSGGHMLSSIQEHLHSRIPELSETLPL